MQEVKLVKPLKCGIMSIVVTVLAQVNIMRMACMEPTGLYFKKENADGREIITYSGRSA